MTRWRRHVVAAVVVIATVAACPARAGGADTPPDSRHQSPRSEELGGPQAASGSPRDLAVGPATAVARGLLFIYQRGASPTKGQRCPMYPSCSEYSRLAVNRYGVLMGVLKTADRLHRCGHDLRTYPVTSDADGWLKAYDAP